MLDSDTVPETREPTMKVRTRLATGLAAAAAVTATGLAVAQAATPAPGPSPAASADAAHQAARPRLLTPAQRTELRTTGHVTVTRHTRKRGDITLHLQVGRITAVSPTSVTVRSRTGYSHSYAITSATKVRERRAPLPVAALAPGDRVLVVATADDTARRITRRPQP